MFLMGLARLNTHISFEEEVRYYQLEEEGITFIVISSMMGQHLHIDSVTRLDIELGDMLGP